MITFEKARQIIHENINPVGVEQVSLLEAVGRVLAVDMISQWDMPFWDNSAMDGYAVRSEDCLTVPCSLKVTGYIPAGGLAEGVTVDPGCAVRIMTGAPVPSGSDAVVPVEETDDGKDQVSVTAVVKNGQHIRYRGEDVRVGALFLRRGTIIRGPEINILAGLGFALVTVYRRPVVAIVSTGDELIEPGRTPGAGEIVNSNALSVAAAVIETGCTARILGIARDNAASHLEKLREGLKADVLITSAGVSSGDRDLVRETLAELGAEQKFWKVAIKPGGPTAFALCGGVPVFSLPGNPVSTLITFEEFVRPALLRMLGHESVFRPLFKAVLRDAVKRKPGKLQIVRVRVMDEGGRRMAVSSGNQQTAILKTMVDANALAVIPAECGSLAAGAEVDVHYYGNYCELNNHGV